MWLKVLQKIIVLSVVIFVVKCVQFMLAESGVIRAGDSLRIRVDEAGLKYPDRIYATNFRKFMATITQVLIQLLYTSHNCSNL